MYGCQTVSAVSGSLLLNRLYVGHFPLAHYRLGHNSKKLLGFGALFFATPPGRKVSLHTDQGTATLAEATISPPVAAAQVLRHRAADDRPGTSLSC